MSKATFSTRTPRLDLSRIDFKVWPKFILDLGADFLSEEEWVIGSPKKPAWKWTIHCLEDFFRDAANKTLFETHGYGAVSYAWGFEYINKPVPIHSSTDPVPSMLDAHYKWEIPKCDLLFTLNDVRRVFKTLGKRFVWWDHACIPQLDLSNGYNNAPPLTSLLKTIRSEEVEKQKAVYELADVGAVWIHRIEWVKDPMIKQILLAAPELSVKEMKDLNALYSNFNYTQAVIPQTARAYLGGAFKNPTTAAKWKDAIDQFLVQLSGVKNEDKWFASLWSFQEGVLLKSQAFLDKSGQYLCHSGITSNSIPPVDKLPFPRIKAAKPDVDALGLWHLTTLTTLLAGYMAQAIRDPSKAIKELAEVTQLPSCSTYLSQKLHALGTSGLLFYPQNSPLEMICAARRSRETNWSELDRYYAMIGVLGITMRADYTGVTEAQAQALFFPAVLQAYQWPTLLLARSLQPPLHPESWWLAVSTGLIEPLGGYFDAGFVAKGAQAPASYPLIHYEQATDEVVLSKPPPLSKPKRDDEPPSLNFWEPASWAKSIFYYILHPLPLNSKISQEVTLGDIKLNEPNLGTDMHLVPVQRLDGATAELNKPFVLTWSPAEKGKPRNVRCLLVKHVSKSAAGIECKFLGVIEVYGLLLKQYLNDYPQIKIKWTL